METVLVTGGVGFIGSELCRQLVSQGYKVRVLDLRKPPAPIEQVEYVQGDVRDLQAVKGALRDVSQIVHFAAIVSVTLCQENPVDSEKTNLLGTMVVLEAARAHKTIHGKTPKVIFASSAAVYGKLGDHGKPLGEAEALPACLSFYAAQKLASEQRLQLFATYFGVPTLSFRFFNVFGMGQDPKSPYSGVISIFLDRIRDKKPLLLQGGGDQTRDFIHVSDIANACVLALKADATLFDGITINLGSGSRVTIAELANTMLSVAKNSGTTQIVESREGDVKHSLADISRAKKLLGWSPKISLTDGLQGLIKSC